MGKRGSKKKPRSAAVDENDLETAIEQSEIEAARIAATAQIEDGVFLEGEIGRYRDKCNQQNASIASHNVSIILAAEARSKKLHQDYLTAVKHIYANQGAGQSPSLPTHEQLLDTIYNLELMSVQHGVHLQRLQATDELRQLQNAELLQLVRFLVHSSTQLVKETHRISRTSNDAVRHELEQTQRDRASISTSVDACALDICSLKEAMAKLEEMVLRCDNTVVHAGTRRAHGDDDAGSARSCGSVSEYRGRSPQYRRETQAFKLRTPSIEKMVRDNLVPEAIFAAQGLAKESKLELEAEERRLCDGAGFSMGFTPVPLVLPFYIANGGIVQGAM